MKASRIRWVAPIVALGLVAAGCGDDDDGGTTATTGGGAESTSATTAGGSATTTGGSTGTTTGGSATTAAGGQGGLGTANPASGEPVKLGLITEEGSEAIGGQSLTTISAFEAGIEYLNEYGGGIGGRPIELFACGNRNTPAGAQDCAQQMVEEDVAAVVLPFDCCGDDQVPIVTGAGIPYIVASGSAQSHLQTPGAFSLTGGYVATLAAVAQHASDQGYAKVTHVVIDVPSATTAAQQLGGLVFGKAGVDYEVIPAAPGTPDLTPQLSTAGDSAVMVTGDLSFCTSFNQAYDTLGLDNPKYIIATCIAPSVLETVPTAFEGAFLPTTLSDASPDAETYAAVIEEYDDSGADPNPFVSGGFATAMQVLVTFSRFVEGIGPDITGETVTAKMRAGSQVPVFLGGEATATCNGTAIPLLPNVCSSGVQVATLNEQGQPTDTVELDVQPLFA